MAVGAQHDVCRFGHAIRDGAEQRGVLGGGRVADGIRQIDRRRALSDGHQDDAAEEVEVGARRVFRRELDVGRVAAGALYRRADPLDAFRAIDAQLLLEVQIRGGDEDVDALALGRLQRLRGGVDVALVATRQRGDDRAPHDFRHLLNAAQVALRCGREARFDDVHAERVELARQSQLGLR